MTRRLAVNPVPCTGCLCCEAACSLRRTGLQDRTASAVRTDLDVFGGLNSISVCRQCEDAPCAAACPPGAISRQPDTGAWILDPGACTGCGICIEACPFGAIWWRKPGEAPVKCDLCGGEPSCSTACRFGVIRFLEPCDPGFAERGMPASEQSQDLGRGSP